LKNLRKGKYRRKFPGLIVSFGVPLLVGTAIRKVWKIFVNGVKPVLGHSIPVMDSISDHGFVRLQPCLLLMKVRFFGNVLFQRWMEPLHSVTWEAPILEFVHADHRSSFYLCQRGSSFGFCIMFMFIFIP
jgi:hypothetical protein